MQASAVIFENPGCLSVSDISITNPDDADVVVEVDWSGISTGTERLLWTGRMPAFPGLGYPLVPGYESVGRVVEAGSNSERKVNDYVFVPGANCFGEIKGLFGGAASHLVVAGKRTIKINESLEENGVLLALAATAYHVIAGSPGNDLPDLIIGHGILGRLLARLSVILGQSAPVVWETDPVRMHGSCNYSVVQPNEDTHNQYKNICDVSGNCDLLNELISRSAAGGEIVLAGFYDQPLSFNFAPAFMREIKLRVSAEWKPQDLIAVNKLINEGRLDLANLVSHRQSIAQADSAYRTAFEDSSCLKMVLDWRIH